MARWVWKNNRWLPCPDGAESHQTSGKYKAMLCLKTWILLSIVSFLRPLVQDSSAAAAEMVERPRKRQAVAHTKWCWTWTASNTVKFHKHRLKRLGFKMTSWLVASFFAVCFPSSGWCGGTFDYVANLATWLDEHFVPRLEAGFSESPKWQLPQSTMFVNRHLTSNAAEYFFLILWIYIMARECEFIVSWRGLIIFSDVRFQNSCQVECSPSCRRILEARMAEGNLPQCKIFPDVLTYQPSSDAIDSECLLGGFPCQVSCSGNVSLINGYRKRWFDLTLHWIGHSFNLCLLRGYHKLESSMG